MSFLGGLLGGVLAVLALLIGVLTACGALPWAIMMCVAYLLPRPPKRR